MANDPSPDLLLAPINGKPRPVSAYVTIFHLVFVALDPFSERSAWLVETSGRILTNYEQADCRVALAVTCPEIQARQFLGPYAQQFLTFADPDRDVVKGLGIERLPALVHIRQDLSVAGAAEGWHPDEWRAVADRLSEAMGWSRPVIPAPRDPAPYEGTRALG